MSAYKIIFSDLDGTLLSDKERVSQENLDAIKIFTQNGGIFVPTSGRAQSEFPPQLLNNPDIRYYIFSDGAVIWDKLTDTYIANYISNKDTQQIFNLTIQYGGRSLVHIDGQSLVDADMPTHFKDYYAELSFKNSNPTLNYKEIVLSSQKTEFIYVYFEDENSLKECKDKIADLGVVEVASSAFGTFQIASSNAGKHNAVLTLTKKLGIDVCDIITVGDNKNDIKMILSAGLGLAVSNADPLLKEAADRVICSNTQHIVHYILEDIL